jgi:hypothetical protein
MNLMRLSRKKGRQFALEDIMEYSWFIDLEDSGGGIVIELT